METFFFTSRLFPRPADNPLCCAPRPTARKYDTHPWCRPLCCDIIRLFSRMEMTMTGIQAMQWAREISKLPEGCFTVAFFPYSKQKGEASNRLSTREGCKYRAQLPDEAFSIDGENFFLFTDANGDPKMCYRILIRYMGFPQDGFKLHKIDWL